MEEGRVDAPSSFVRRKISSISEMAKKVILPWLPTSMAIELIDSLFAHGGLPDNAPFSIAGLSIYGLIFAALAARRFRWEA